MVNEDGIFQLDDAPIHTAYVVRNASSYLIESFVC